MRNRLHVLKGMAEIKPEVRHEVAVTQIDAPAERIYLRALAKLKMRFR